MFTALFVSRLFFEILLSRRIIKEHLVMFRLIHQPNVNWMGARRLFFLISSVLVVGGLFIFFTRDDSKNNKYDIEFTGGTSAQINFKEGVELTREQVEERIHKTGQELGNAALSAANVYSIGKSTRSYEINTTETNKTKTTISFPQSETHTTESVTEAIEMAQKKVAGTLRNLRVSPANSGSNTFVVETSQMNKSAVKAVLTTAFAKATISEPQVHQVVNDAILKAFGDELEIQRNLQPRIISEEKITEQLIKTYPELADFIGGVKIGCEIELAASVEQIERRLADLRFKPDMQHLAWYSYRISGPNLDATEPNEAVSSFVYISTEPEAGIRELEADEWNRFVENEKAKVLAATMLETSLPRVTAIDPSIGAEAKTRAVIAIVLSLFAIVGYIWVRFGNARYGLAAIIALVHDVSITLGAVTVCTYIASTSLGQALLIGDFKINLAMIAAFLTLIGYSLNDTIVVFDRIRENRRKGTLNPAIITNSINQTISRTLMTSFTTLAVVVVMYIWGGQALRGFTFAIGFGIIVGTYSSIAIAAPVLLLQVAGKKEPSKSVEKQLRA